MESQINDEASRVLLARDSNANKLAERNLILNSSPNAAIVVPDARQLETLRRHPIVRLTERRAQRLVEQPAARRRSGHVTRDARRAAAQQPVEVFAKARANAVKRYWVDARVEVGEHESRDLRRVPKRAVLLARVRMEVEPQQEDVRRQEANGEQHHERLF